MSQCQYEALGQRCPLPGAHFSTAHALKGWCFRHNEGRHALDVAGESAYLEGLNASKADQLDVLREHYGPDYPLTVEQAECNRRAKPLERCLGESRSVWFERMAAAMPDTPIGVKFAAMMRRR